MHLAFWHNTGPLILLLLGGVLWYIRILTREECSVQHDFNRTRISPGFVCHVDSFAKLFGIGRGISKATLHTSDPPQWTQGRFWNSVSRSLTDYLIPSVYLPLKTKQTFQGKVHHLCQNWLMIQSLQTSIFVMNCKLAILALNLKLSKIKVALVLTDKQKSPHKRFKNQTAGKTS